MGIRGRFRSVKAGSKSYKGINLTIKLANDRSHTFTANFNGVIINGITAYDLNPLPNGSIELTLKIEIPDVTINSVTLSGLSKVSGFNEEV